MTSSARNDVLRRMLLAACLMSIVAGAVGVTAQRWMVFIDEVGVAGTVESEAGRDFRAFSVSGSLAFDREVDLIYRSSAEPYVSANAARFVYPPWYAMTMMPWRSIGFQAGYWMWLAITGVLAVIALASLTRSGLLVGALALFVAAPGLQVILYGQTTYLVVAGVAVLAWSTARKNAVLAGVAAGLVAFKPQLLVGIGVVWLLDRVRGWVAIASAVAVSGALFTVSALWLPSSWMAWTRVIVGEGASLVDPVNEITIGAFVGALTGRRVSTWVSVLILVLGMAWLVSVLVRRCLDPGTVVFVAFGASIVFGLHALLYDVLVLVPAAALVWRYRESDRRVFGVAAIGTLGLLTLSGFAADTQYDAFGHAFLVGPLSLAVLVGWLGETAPRRATPIGGFPPRDRQLDEL